MSIKYAVVPKVPPVDTKLLVSCFTEIAGVTHHMTTPMQVTFEVEGDQAISKLKELAIEKDCNVFPVVKGTYPTTSANIA